MSQGYFIGKQGGIIPFSKVFSLDTEGRFLCDLGDGNNGGTYCRAKDPLKAKQDFINWLDQ